MAFSEKEREGILSALKAEGRKCAIAVGVRKTTVEQLARAAEISKGAFYGFYATKELLFFDILEELHTETYEAARLALTASQGLSDASRAAEAVLAACKVLDASGLTGFIERDVPYILRKIPQDMLEEHYHDDEAHIRALLRDAGLRPEGGVELAAAAVRGLLLTVSHRHEIGAMYPQVLKTLVNGVCRELFA